MAVKFERTGMLLIISGPSGTGKGTLVKKLMDSDPSFRFSCSVTTRKPRDNEIEGVHYHFVTEEAFDRLVSENAFLEHATVHGHRYGTLRQPVEDGKVTVSRAAATVTYPSRFILLAAMNPCRCGYFGHPTRACTCTPSAIETYRRRVSGPLLDRIDLHVEVGPVQYSELAGSEKGECSADIRKRVIAARAVQTARYARDGIRCNGELSGQLLRKYCQPDAAAAALLQTAFDRLGLSARAYDRILKVSRTIADLAGCEQIGAAHLAEALQYRSLDRKYWYDK